MSCMILVADGGQARILRGVADGGRAKLAEVETLARPSLHLPARALTTDLTGRVFSYAARGASGQGRPVSTPHGAQSDYNPHQAEVLRFARRVAARLEQLLAGPDAGALVILAEPRFLGLLRKALLPAARRHLSAERAGDYVRSPLARIARLPEARQALLRERLPIRLRARAPGP